MRPRLKARRSIHGRLRLARLLQLPERDLAAKIRELEGSPLFAVLQQSGAVAIEPYSNARFSARRFGGWSLRAPKDGLGAVIEGQDAALGLAAKIGQELFERCFLQGSGMSDAERAGLCGLSVREVHLLRQLVDRLEVQAEFEEPGAAAPGTTFSVVAGVEIQGRKPVLGFFHRDVWKGRYRVEAEKLRALQAERDDFAQLQELARELEHFNRRRTTLYRLLETLLEEQADFFLTGKLERRRPLSQKELAGRIGSSPSVVNALILNKALQLPSGIDVELKVLVPSRKTVTKDLLYGLAAERPKATDEELRREIFSRHGVRLGRRSVAQYRKELRLGSTKGGAKR